jgi:hypothetical protein
MKDGVSNIVVLKLYFFEAIDSFLSNVWSTGL